jgi:ankyrin
LILAASSGHADVLEYLLESGADIDNCDFAGLTPLAATARGDHLDCAKMVIGCGASLHLVEQEKISLASPTIEAIRCGSKAMLSLLLDSGIDISATTQRRMPLIVALTEGYADIVDLLINHGADVDGDETARHTIGWPVYVPHKKLSIILVRNWTD